MCGICGIFRPDNGPIDPQRVTRMRDAMTRRGPDDSGLACGPGFALGHRRLSIIDLSPAGHQPMENEDGSVIIMFNGEIYNFADLRPEPGQAGHRFRSRTDTETLIHGYEQWGLEGLLRRIRGMYAFAIVDLRQAAAIHLVRDPLGKKPLFFRWAEGELSFASSARALVEAIGAAPAIDAAAVDALLWNRYIPGPGTIFAGVEKLSPGHAWSLGSDGAARRYRHWQPDFFHAEKGVAENVWLDRVEEALTTAVRRRFVADVPVGVMLSGGVDSSLVTAIAAKTMGAVKTFCVANEDLAADESGYALAVARRYHTDHHVLPVRSNVRANLPQLVAAMGEPLADASAANLLAIAQLARQSVTVVLTGDGGDEAFGGYTEFWAARTWPTRTRRWLPAMLLPPLRSAGEWLRGKRGNLRRAGTFLGMVVNPLEDTCAGLRRAEAILRDTLYTPQFHAALQGRRPGDHVYAALGENAGGSWSDRVMQDAHADRAGRQLLAQGGLGDHRRQPGRPLPLPRFRRDRTGHADARAHALQRRQAERAAAPVGPSLPAGGGHRPPQARVQCPDRSVVPPRLAQPDRAVHPGAERGAARLVPPRGPRATRGRTCPRRRPRRIALGLVDPGTLGADGGGRHRQSRGKRLMAKGPKMPPAKVTHLIATLRRGGAEKQLWCLATALRRQGWPQSVIAFDSGGAWESRLREAGIAVYGVAPHRIKPWRLWRLRRLLRQERPQIVMSWSSSSAIYARWACPRRPALQVFGIRGDLTIDSNTCRPARHFWLVRNALEHADCAVSNSQYSLEALRGAASASAAAKWSAMSSPSGAGPSRARRWTGRGLSPSGR